MINLKTTYPIPANILKATRALLPEIQADPMSGWLNLPSHRPPELNRIKSAAQKINSDSDYLVCIGIGGSYLGHRALIEALRPHSRTKILYAGNSFSSIKLQDTLDRLAGQDFSLNVISKSGTTLEPALAFRILKDRLVQKYGEKASERIYVTTDATSGPLRAEAEQNHYAAFTIPDNVGGRFSVFTPVGLLPLAVSGIDIDALLDGAALNLNNSTTKTTSPRLNDSAATETTPRRDNPTTETTLISPDHPAYVYAALREAFREEHFDTEVLATFEPRLEFVAEWWKQLFGESEGKENGGLFPASVLYSNDLHSLGQYLQEGRKNLFETFLTFNHKSSPKFTIPSITPNLDGLDYLEGHTLSEISKIAEAATISAHSKQRPTIEIELPDLSATSLGELIYFFELSCALSAKLQGVNPFNQPGVEQYKAEMFHLLRNLP